MKFRELVMGLGALAALAPSAGVAEEPAGGKLWAFIGTYTGPKSQGIYRLELDLSTGKMSTPELAAETPSPSFLAIRPDRRALYAVNEVEQYQGKRSGSITAFALDPARGTLTPLNQTSSEGAAPCYIVTDAAGRHVLVANYTGGSIAVVGIGEDGKLGATTAAIQHRGSGADKSRQDAPHAHSINLDKANRFAVAADLGLDQLLVYRYDAAKGTLTPNDPPSARVAPGSGPRHFAFHPDGRHAYAINEMALTVTAFTYDPDRGTLAEIQTVPTTPDGVRPGYSTAEVVVHPSGKFLYGSNRGHDSLAIYSIDPSSGRLTLIGHQPTGGKTPRNFAIEPSGRYLLAANQGSNTVVAYRIDPATGKLEPTGSTVNVGSPVCVRFVAPGEAADAGR